MYKAVAQLCKDEIEKKTIIYRKNRVFFWNMQLYNECNTRQKLFNRYSIEIYQVKPVHCPIVPVQGD